MVEGDSLYKAMTKAGKNFIDTALTLRGEATESQIHCHNLIWHEHLPMWVTDGKFDNRTLISIMDDHINAVVTRYKGICTRWDIVNEALHENGTYRSSVWFNTIGEAFIPIAFSLAKKYDNGTKLFCISPSRFA